MSSPIDSWDNNIPLSLSFKTVEVMVPGFNWSLMFHKLYIPFPSYKAKASNSLICFRMLVFNKIIGPLAILS